MDWLDLPPLNSLRAFAALAATGSFTRAGEELGVTQAAVSQQVKALETRLGVGLVERSGRSIALTAEGISLAAGLEAGFAQMRRSLEALTRLDAARPLQITMSPAFAAEWMLPRIPEFQRRHPEITLLLNPSAEIMELKPGGIDLAVRYLERPPRKSAARPLLVLDTGVIGTPALLGRPATRDPQALASLPWLEELGRNDVAQWFQRRGIVPDRPLSVTRMPGGLIMQAVRRGVGVTISVRDYFAEDIRSGSVVVAFPEAASASFYLFTAPGPTRPAVKTFLAWLRRKAGAETAKHRPKESAPS